MLIENVDDFATWLIDELKGLCEADPVTLSKYVIALLKKDKSERDLKKICIDQLNVFLEEKTKDFVESVFECLKHNKHIQSIKSEELKNEMENTKFMDVPIINDAGSQKRVDDNISMVNISAKDLTDLRKYSPRIIDDGKKGADKKDIDRRDSDRKDIDRRDTDRRDNEKRDNDKRDADRRDNDKRDIDKRDADKREVEKRDFDRRDASRRDSDKRDIDSRSYSKRSLDYSGCRGSEESRKRRRYDDDVDLRDRRRHSSRQRSHKSKRHVMDRLEPDQKHFGRSDDTKLIGFTNEPKQWDIKTSCPDFVEKGVCLKGDSCEFDHGTDIVRSNINCIYAASGINQTIVNPNWPPMSMNQAWVDYPQSKQHKNLVHLKNIDDKNDHCDYRHGAKSNIDHNTDIYDPSHPEIDPMIHDTDIRNGSNDQVPVYVPSKVESGQKDGSWWREIDDASITNNSEGSQVTTIIGSGKNRSRRTVSPIKRGRFNNNANTNTNTGFNNNYNNNNFNNNNNNYNNNNYNNNNYNNSNNFNNSNYNNNNFNTNNNNFNNNNKFNKRTANARCLLVTHIPVDCNEKMKLKEHFGAFGTITDVEVRFQNDPQHALIEFANTEQAKTAFRSPLPILDNRFIRTSLFARSSDSNNLRVCKDVDESNEVTDRRQVVQHSAPSNDKESDDEMVVDKWPQHSQSSDEERTVVVNDEPKRIEKKAERWPVASELKFDRRDNSTGIGSSDTVAKEMNQENVPAQFVYKKEDKNIRLTEAQIERQKKLKEINDRKELDIRIERLEDSVQSCKNRLKNLLSEQKNPDCDKDLVKKQLIEAYNYYKDLREMHDSLKKKRGPRPELSPADKLKLKIKNIQGQLADMEKDSDNYKTQLRMITEMKRELVKLQTITKGTKPSNRLPSLLETKLDNRPKTLYLTGSYCNNPIEFVKLQFKKYQIEKLEAPENDALYYTLKFKTRNEADRVVSEMSKVLKDKDSLLSFDRPIRICDPLDFKTRSDTQRGTPRDNCASSDEEDESKMN